jgi:two-component system CheB/CheR fusion protein
MSVDRGRRISDLTHRLGYSEFVEDAERVMRRLTLVEREVRTPDGNWLLIRLRPYHTNEDRIEGVVTSFIDINKLKEVEGELLNARDLLEKRVSERTQELNEANRELSHARDLFYLLFNANPIPAALTLMEDGVFINVNDEFLNYFSLERDKLIGHSEDELGLGLRLGLGANARKAFNARIKEKGRIGTYESEVTHPSGGLRNVLASVQYLRIDHTDALITAFIDITDRVRAEQQIRSLAYHLTTAEQEERQRISQILHDDLQQRIFAIKLQVSTLYDEFQKGNVESSRADFAQLQESLDESISITRNLSIDLSPAILKGDGLTDALVWLSAQMEKQYGLKVALNSNGIVGRFDAALRILLFQAVREILFNIVKHANTLEANILMERVDGRTRITVSDGGMGFDAQAILEGSKTAGGLLNLQHRLNLMGCSLQVKSQPNINGTQVIIDVPLGK